MIIVTLRVVARAEKLKSVLEIANAHSGQTQVQSGCMSARFYRGIDDPNSFLLIEEWMSKADLDRHLRSEYYRNILALIEMSREMPEMKFNTISSTTGMEGLKATRNQTGRNKNSRKEVRRKNRVRRFVQDA